MDKGVATVHWQHVIGVRAGAIATGSLSEDHIESLAQDLKAAIKENKITTKAVVAGVNSVGGVFATRTTIDHHNPRDIRKHLSNVVMTDAKVMGFRLEDVVIDLAVLNEIKTEENTYLDSFIVAVRETVLDNINTVITKAGLRLVGVDVNALAVLRSLKTVPRGMGQIDVVVDIGADIASILIHENGKPVHLQLNTGLGGRDADMAIAREMQAEDPTQTLSHKVRGDRDYRATAGLETYFAQIKSAIDNEISTYLNSRTTGDGVAGITLVGAGSLVPGLRDALSRMTNVPVIIGELDSTIGGEVEQYKKGQLVSTDYTASIGLAIGGSI